MDKLSEIVKIPMLREGQPVKEYLDLLAVTLRNMLELITQNTNTLQQIVINEGGGGVVNHHALAGLHTAGDHTAADITNIPAGSIAATTVQAAINELDTEKSATGHGHDHGALTGLSDADHVAASIAFAATGKVLARVSGGAGAGEESAVTEALQLLANNTTCNVSNSAHGYCPVHPNDVTQVLRGDGTWGVFTFAPLIFQTHLHYDIETFDELETYDEKTDYGSNAPTITLDSTDLGQLHVLKFTGTANVTLPVPGAAGKWIAIVVYSMASVANQNIKAATDGSIWTHKGKVVQNDGNMIILYGFGAIGPCDTPLILVSRSATDWSVFSMPYSNVVSV